METRNIDAKVGELIRKGEVFPSKQLFDAVREFGSRVERINSSELTVKKLKEVCDQGKEAIQNIELDIDNMKNGEEIKIELFTAFIHDAVDACLDRSAEMTKSYQRPRTGKKDASPRNKDGAENNSEEKTKKTTVAKKNSVDTQDEAFVNASQKYQHAIYVIVEKYKTEVENHNFSLEDFDSTSDLPEKLKARLCYGVFAQRYDNELRLGNDVLSTKDYMDSKLEVKAAAAALKIYMPHASESSIASFYAHVSKKFRDKTDWRAKIK